jgi:hypothetical protein
VVPVIRPPLRSGNKGEKPSWLKYCNRLIYFCVSAADIIKQVAALPPHERVRFEQLLSALERKADPEAPASQSRWPDFGQRLRNIYGDKVLTDSQALIDEGRGTM